METDHKLRAPPGGGLTPKGNAPSHPHLPRPLSGPQAAPRGPRLPGEQRDLGSPGGLAAGLQGERVATAAPGRALHKGAGGQGSQGAAAGRLLCGPPQSRPALFNPHNKPARGMLWPRFTGLPTAPLRGDFVSQSHCGGLLKTQVRALDAAATQTLSHQQPVSAPSSAGEGGGPGPRRRVGRVSVRRPVLRPVPLSVV